MKQIDAVTTVEDLIVYNRINAGTSLRHWVWGGTINPSWWRLWRYTTRSGAFTITYMGPLQHVRKN
jgi:hypothetical protein